MITPEEKTPAKKAGRGPSKSLTVTQKAEAAALWRAGNTTLEELAKKFKKRPETFSRLFSSMGIAKGSGAAAALKKAEELVSARALSDTEETLKRISEVKDRHYMMSVNLARMAFQEIVNAKKAELDIGKLKDTMAVYKLASDVVGNSRKELFELLNVEKFEASSEMDDLPDLTVRELTSNEIFQIQEAEPIDDDDAALGDGMIDLDEDEDD